jgi:hypothetical protein
MKTVLKTATGLALLTITACSVSPPPAAITARRVQIGYGDMAGNSTPGDRTPHWFLTLQDDYGTPGRESSGGSVEEIEVDLPTYTACIEGSHWPDCGHGHAVKVP